MSKIIIANWKMNPQIYEEAESLFLSIRDFLTGKKFLNLQTIICPPFTWLTDLSHKHRETLIKFGAQNVFWEKEGSYTGEISPIMLKNSKVEYVIIGHSERRYTLAETDEMVNKKLKASLEAGLKPILCVGEREKKSLEQAKEFIKEQLDKDLKSLELKTYNLKLIIAYEPVWAISGSGGTADKPEQSLEIISFIRKWLEEKGLQNVRTIYGGSVDEENIESFIKYPEIEGVLVGNASLNFASFRKIIEIAEKF